MNDFSAETYSPDHLGGSFKRYVVENAMPQILEQLKRGLDELSCAYIDYCLESALQFPDLRHRHLFAGNRALDHWYPDWLVADVTKNVALNPPCFGHGLSILPETVLQSIRNTIFLDLGAYDGWSVYEMEKFHPRMVHSFDISIQNKALYQKTSEQFRYPFHHHLLALSDRRGEMEFFDNGTSGTNVYHWERNARVETMTLDEFANVTLNQQRIGFIKMDIEGSEMSAIRGGLNTIARDRPVLSVSVYHNPKDFFEIKPLLESLDVGYQFLIRKLSICEEYTPFLDTILLAYPEA